MSSQFKWPLVFLGKYRRKQRREVRPSSLHCAGGCPLQTEAGTSGMFGSVGDTQNHLRHKELHGCESVLQCVVTCQCVACSSGRLQAHVQCTQTVTIELVKWKSEMYNTYIYIHVLYRIIYRETQRERESNSEELLSLATLRSPPQSCNSSPSHFVSTSFAGAAASNDAAKCSDDLSHRPAQT